MDEAVTQLAECRIVYPVVAGSSPVSLAVVAVAQMVERRVVVSVVEGSNPFSHPLVVANLSFLERGGCTGTPEAWPPRRKSLLPKDLRLLKTLFISRKIYI